MLFPLSEKIANKFIMRIPETNEVSPLAHWNTYYLRELDDSGIIDGLYKYTQTLNNEEMQNV